MSYRLQSKWMVMVCMLSASLISETTRSQSTHIISPREYSTAVPSVYPSGIYVMDAENDAPYNWIYDAGMILGLKRSQTNFRHIQLVIRNNGSSIAMRGKDGQNDSWLSWKYIRDETWIEDNFVQKDENGNAGIGTAPADEKLTVAGTGKFRELIVEENTGADFVFEEDYELPDLSELETFIKSNKHLPEIPTADQMKAKGVKVGELQMKLLQKIEELTLYVIEQSKTINQLKSENKEIKQQLKQGVHNECEKQNP